MFPSAQHILLDPNQIEFNKKSSLLESVFISYSNINYEAGHESSTDTKSIDSDTHLKKRKKHLKRKKKKEKKEPKKKKEKLVVKDHGKNNLVFLDDMFGVSFEDAFRLDRSQESSIRTFGCTYAGHVPNYKKLVRSTLGLDYFDPYRKPLTKQEMVKKFMKTRYFFRRNCAKARRLGTKIATRSDARVSISDFIVPLPSDLDGDEKFVEMDFEQEATGDKVRQLKSRLQENPHNVDVWLKLIDLQEDAVRLQLMDAECADGDAATTMSRHHSQVSHRIVHDKRQAVLQRALVANPGSVQLKLYQMQMNFGYTESEILRREWQQLTFTHPNNMDVWLRYMDFLESDFVRYTMRAVLPVYTKCLSTATRLLSGAMLSHTVLPHTWWKALGLWGRLISRLTTTGFTERATALWQAQMQVMLKGSLSRQDIETWWESVAPRFGEPDWISGCGQDEQLDDSEEDADATAEKDENVLLQDDLQNDVALLVMLEKIRERHLWRPWRCKNAADVEPADLDRQVVVDDFFGVLLPMWQAPDLVRRYFMLLFFAWHGVNYHFSQLHTLCAAFPLFFGWLEPLLCQQKRQDSAAAVPSSARWLRNCLRQCPLHLVHNAQHLLLCETMRTAQQSRGSLREVRSVVRRLLAESYNRKDLGLWSRYAQLEWEMGKQAEARKIFDTALTAGGQVVWPSAEVAKDDVYLRDCLARVELIRVYLELELDLPRGIDDTFTEGDPVKRSLTRAQELMMHATLGEVLEADTITGGVVMRARHSAEQHVAAMRIMFQQLTESSSEDGLDVVMRLFALSSYMASLLELLLVDGYSNKINNIFRTCSFELYSKRDGLKETSPIVAAQIDSQAAEVVRWEIQIAWWHARRRQAYLTDARKLLARAMRLHPTDAGLLRLVTKWESGASCRRLLDMAITAALDTSLLPGLFALNVDLERWEKSPQGVGALCRLRTTLERLLGSNLGRTTPLLWSQCLRIESRTGTDDTHQRRVRDTLFRALREVPWSKALYLEGAMTLQRWPKSSQEVLDLLIEKELRQRVLLEEVPVLRESVSSLT